MLRFRHRPSAGLTTTQIVLIVLGAVAAGGLLVLALLAAMLLPALSRAREEARRIRCRNNLNQLAKGFATYLNEFGDNRFYPCPLGQGVEPDDYNGAEWLASLYWSSTTPDPGVFLCPSTKDGNADGADIGAYRAPAAFGPQTISYAGMHYYSGSPPGYGQRPAGVRVLKIRDSWGGTEFPVATDASGNILPGALRDDFPPNMPMASDDTHGTINHGTRNRGGMAVMFFDSHVEFKTNTELDLEKSVGQDGGLLTQLRN